MPLVSSAQASNIVYSLYSQALELYVRAAKEDGDAASGHRVSLMALKCLNNAIWDQPAGQTSFVRLQGLNMLVGLLKVMRRAAMNSNTTVVRSMGYCCRFEFNIF